MKKLEIKKKRVISQRQEAEHQDYLDRIRFCARNFVALHRLVMRRKIRGHLLFTSEGDFTVYLYEKHLFYSRIPTETLDDILRTYCSKRYRVILRNAGINYSFRAYYFPYGQSN